MRRVTFLSSCRLRDAADGLLTWRRAGGPLAVRWQSEPEGSEDDEEAAAAAAAAEAEDAAWMAQAQALVSALPAPQQQLFAANIRAFVDALAARAAARVAARPDEPDADVLTVEDVRACEAALRARWARGDQ